ncbi:MAG: glycosyltransferase family 1 protein [Candidatus Korobacteraceae bacterium]
MRIGVNATAFGNRYTGIGLFTEFLIDGLCATDHEVFVYCSEEAIEELGAMTFRRTPASLSFGAGRLANLRRFAWLQSSFPSLLKRDGVQLLISPSVEGLLWPKLPQIVTVHDLMPLRYIEENPRQYYYYRYVLSRVLAATNLVLTVSEFSRQEIIKLFDFPPDRVAVTSTGIRPELFCRSHHSQGRVADAPYFLFVGTFSPRKNLKTIVRAFAEIAAVVPEKLAIVAYPDQWKDDIVQLAAQLNVSSRLTYHSGLTNDRLADLYRNATALVLVSEYEGLGAPPLEAMAAGTPAIVSDSTSLAEVGGGAALTVPCEDVKAVASAMRAVSTQSDVRDSLREQGRRRAERYHRARCITILNRALEPLLQESICV